MASIKVKKRDGVIEVWNYDKVLLSIGKAFIPIKEAEKIASEIENWAKKNVKKERIISSIDIRDKVIELLKRENPVAADSYTVYKKG